MIVVHFVFSSCFCEHIAVSFVANREEWHIISYTAYFYIASNCFQDLQSTYDCLQCANMEGDMLQTAEVEMAWARGLVISAPTHNATTVCACTQACFNVFFCGENSLKLRLKLD